ncbi:phosphomannomutase/phosphoglucomutase [Candidatus Babeliales bacterium]|nr:phosphomannomutase/phosphoglucomutase [Candidatus Babeliales bacterium]MCF7899067.1 phosphomannomutase/phosphoglucomutase [Candidatus Babeliales bacterium]
MKSCIFREYDIRGIFGKEFEINEVYNLAKAIITYFKKQKPEISDIIVARDGRSHSEPMRNQIIKAITDLGINVTDIGVAPTPVLYFSLFNTQITSGLIITASHNPKEYNGIKICLDQRSVWGKQIQEIRKIYETNDFYQNKSGKIGIIKNYNIIPEYIEYLCKNFKHLKNLEINTIIDCGNGTAGTIFPELVKKMQWQNVKLLFQEVDGNFPNHEADPTVYKNMQFLDQELKDNSDIQIGIGLDGDCDRMSPMTKTGYLVPGDQLLALFSQKILKEHPNAAIVFDIKASSSLIDLLNSWGAKACICPSGHAWVKEHMKKNSAKLAGELSCHFFFNDRYFGYDDGIYASLRLIEILHETQQDLSELISIFPEKFRSSEIRIPCQEEAKTKIVDHIKNSFENKKDSNLITIDGIRAQMPYGWGLVRASNTQPVICLRFESDSQNGLNQIKSDFTEILNLYFDPNILKEFLV